MTAVEEAVLDAAKYLRSVRPLDPHELIEYVEADIDPNAVTRILRAHAVSLRILERDDGTFAPPPSGPIDGTAGTIEALPSALDDTLEAILEERFGPDWAHSETGDRLRDAIRSLKARYLEGGSISYADLDPWAYLIYHFPRSYAATRAVLHLLADDQLLAHHFSILDVGAGVGPHFAAVVDTVPTEALVEYHAIEPTDQIDVLEEMSERYAGRNVHLTTDQTGVETADLDGPFDVILLGNVLSEVDDPSRVARDTLDLLATDGTWVALAPADPRTSRQLREVERTLCPPATIYAPTLRLWSDREPSDDMWSFVEGPPIERPTVQRVLAAGAAPDSRRAYTNTAVRYAYSILRLDGRRSVDIEADSARFAPLGDLHAAIGKRVNVVAVKLSGDLAEKDGALFRIGDGSQTDPTFASVVQWSSLNEALRTTPYGGIVTFERALVLWNDDEDAMHLVVDDESIVDHIAP